MIEFVDWIMWHIVPTIETECVVVFSKKDRLEAIEQTQRFLALRWYINSQDDMYEDIFLTIENTEPKVREKEIAEKICRKIADVFATSTFRERLFLYETYPQFFGGASVYLLSKQVAYSEYTKKEREERKIITDTKRIANHIDKLRKIFEEERENGYY